MMIKRAFRIYPVIFLVCVAGAVCAQGQAVPGTVTQPVLTYIVDNASQVRPVIGIAGAASVGPALNLGFGVTQAAVPPAHNYVVATPQGSNWPILLQLQNGAVTPQFAAFTAGNTASNCDTDISELTRQSRQNCSPPASANSSANIDHVALSPTGSAAALASSAQGRIYLFTGLPAAAVLAGQIDIRGLGAITAMGISDDGRTVAIGVSNGQTGSLFVANPGIQPRLAASLQHPVAIAFLHNSSDAIVADDSQNAIYYVSAGQVYGVASAADGVAAPVAVAVSNDNQRVFAANSQSRSVMTIALSGEAAAPVYCNCALTGMYPTSTDSVFRLTDFTGSPILLFDANRATPRITYVPVSGSQF
jgi:hypothetical protein